MDDKPSQKFPYSSTSFLDMPTISINRVQVKVFSSVFRTSPKKFNFCEIADDWSDMSKISSRRYQIRIQVSIIYLNKYQMLKVKMQTQEYRMNMVAILQFQIPEYKDDQSPFLTDRQEFLICWSLWHHSPWYFLAIKLSKFWN